MSYLTCRLCEEVTVITCSLCPSCRKIKHMMNIYTRDIVYDVLEKVLIRDNSQREYKIKNYKKPLLNDSTYIDKTSIEGKKLLNSEILEKFK